VYAGDLAVPLSHYASLILINRPISPPLQRKHPPAADRTLARRQLGQLPGPIHYMRLELCIRCLQPLLSARTRHGLSKSPRLSRPGRGKSVVHSREDGHNDFIRRPNMARFLGQGTRVGVPGTRALAGARNPL
jgi:hypothetical protein